MDSTIARIPQSVYDFYKDRSVIVTGSTGMLGTHLTELLLEVGARVIPFSTADGDLRHWSDTLDHIRDAIGYERRVTHMFHLAAKVSGIYGNKEHPVGHLMDNTYMSLNAIQSAWHFNIPNVIVAGSVCAYPEFVSMPMKEQDLWYGPIEYSNRFYGEAKRYALTALQAFYTERMIRNYAYLISANLYGPHDHFDDESNHVIPALIHRISKAVRLDSLVDDEVVIWGDGSATRDFLFVEDAALAYLLAGIYISGGNNLICNIGSGSEISIRELAEMLCRLLDYNRELVFDPSKPAGQARRVLDISAASKALNWKPSFPLSDGLALTIKYYRETHPYNG